MCSSSSSSSSSSNSLRNRGHDTRTHRVWQCQRNSAAANTLRKAGAPRHTPQQLPFHPTIT
jgi:hypothetical protein